MNHTPPKQLYRVLVVDDNPAIHADFRKILCSSTPEQSGLDAFEAVLFDQAVAAEEPVLFELDSALQGQEGFARVQQSIADQRPYSLIFMDVRMPPGWDGIETTAEIWKVDPEVHIVICTAYSDYSWNEMIVKLGASDRLVILKKPFDNIEVLQLALALTHKWQLLQQTKHKLDELEELVRERTTELTATNQTLLAEITGRKALEHERQLMEVQLRQSQKLEAIGQLAAGIAHEINTPTQYIGDNTRFLKDSFASLAEVFHSHETLLAAARANTLTPAVLAHAEAVLAGADTNYLFEQIPKAINETLEGIDRVTKIVRAMKEFSHPGGKEKISADLNQAIESTLAVAHHEWKYVADLKLDLDPTLPRISCFLGEFNQCLLNLVVNAVHAIGDVVKMQPGTKGLITVRTRRVGEAVEICLSDTGTGIPKAVQPHIFEPFFTTKDVGKGTGQGLSIVYGNIVKKHGGTVGFETEAGKGTTFILRLPIQPASGAVQAQTPAISQPAENSLELQPPANHR